MENVNYCVASFLKCCISEKNQLDHFKRVRVVLGNATCDLDSAVCSLVYSLLCQNKLMIAKKNDDTIVFPLFNILKSELCMKTEVVFWLKENGIPLDLVITRSDLDLKSLHKTGQLELVLVDHHVLGPDDSYLNQNIVEIFDHRPAEVGWEWAGKKTLMRVGSCTSLIAKEVMQHQENLLTQELCLLLYGPILLDTACLSPTAGRATQLDLDVVSELDRLLGFSINREEIFQKLLDARSDIASLSPSQILVKDLKIISTVPICGLPILVQEFIKQPGVKHALEEFCAARNISTMMIMGLRIVQNSITRDLAIFSASESNVGQQIMHHLKGSSNPPLLLEPVETESTQLIPGLSVFQQSNIKASRKEVVPLVKAAIESIQEILVQ